MILDIFQVKHIMHVSTFSWKDKFQGIEFDDKKITFLEAIPITEEEYIYAEQNGSDTLGKM